MWVRNDELKGRDQSLSETNSVTIDCNTMHAIHSQNVLVKSGDKERFGNCFLIPRVLPDLNV